MFEYSFKFNLILLLQLLSACDNLFVLADNHNALAVASLWAPVIAVS